MNAHRFIVTQRLVLSEFDLLQKVWFSKIIGINLYTEVREV